MAGNSERTMPPSLEKMCHSFEADLRVAVFWFSATLSLGVLELAS